MNIVFGFLRIAGGILCAVGDMLFDLKGKGILRELSCRALDWGCTH